MKQGIAFALLCCGLLTAIPARRATASEMPDPVAVKKTKQIVQAPASPAVKETIASLARLALEAGRKGNLQLAEAFYQKLLDLDAPDSAKKTALRQMAEMYEKNHVYSKAIAVYEKINSLFALDPDAPVVLLKLGWIYRETGAFQMAIVKFYSVLNAALKINGSGDLDSYKVLAQQAQIEIAETYFIEGDYQQADKFFALLSRLDLSHEESARVAYKSAYCRFLLGDYAGAATAARNFGKDFSDTEYAAECRYILASSLKGQNKVDEATTETLSLLRAERPKEKTDPEKWAYWQKKTGNQLANDLYQQGEFVKALTIYQALAKLDETPEWQLPVIYQIGLCFERLRLPPRALEAYNFILDRCKKAGGDGAALPSSLDTLRQMAQWRSEQVAWIQDADIQLQTLLGPKQLPAEVKAASATFKKNNTP